MKQDVMVGMEVHVELDTESKLFCSCSTTAEIPNSATCEVCLGHPGSKPVVNKKAIDYALKLALALNCKISPELIFSRKSYFYPDMSKNYQITQYEIPLGKEGSIKIGEKEIGIIRVHLEEDPASLVHKGSMETSPYVLVDYNRSGRPLCEIVTKPDIGSAEEARDFMKKLITILRYLKIFDIKKCIIKADVNVSVAESGNTKVEIKNVSGFKEIENAVKYEVERQKREVKEGKKIKQETRGWNPETGSTFFLRSKETEDDYGYIFDPDLVVIDIKKESIEKAKKEMPELPSEKAKKFVKLHKLKPEDAEILSAEIILADLFEKLAAEINPLAAAKWLRRELPRIAHYNKKELEELDIDERHIIELLAMVEKGEITEAVAKKILEKMLLKTFSPKEYVKKEKLAMVGGASELKKLCEEAVKENPTVVDDYKKGRLEALNFLVGQVMRKTKGTANPVELKEIIKKIII
jgi:aspartyl-tRNA(Asn)/glutamyl-tRNA(Gln) amidotransferase subunit B